MNNDYIEFSKIYKRVMDVEIKLKNSFFNALKTTYPTTMFTKLIPGIKKYLAGKHKEWRKNQQRDLLFDLINKKDTEENKHRAFVKIAYLSDIIKLLIEYQNLHRDTKFTMNIYGEKLIFNDVKKYGSGIVKLRNTIMHFNINDYKTGKNNHLAALYYWEKVLKTNNCFFHKFNIKKITIINILKEMQDKCPNFNTANDRYLCNVFDDIACMNGVKIENLPKLWTIGRTIYNLKKQLNKPFK